MERGREQSRGNRCSRLIPGRHVPDLTKETESYEQRNRPTMGTSRGVAPSRPRITIQNHLPTIDRETRIGSIHDGLTSDPKRISSMYFYDARGSRLFEEITRQPEYYPTRIEKGLVKEAASTMQDEMKDLDLVEIGSGDCSKISILLDEVKPADMGTIRYVPVDVSQAALEDSADKLGQRYPDLSIHGVAADFNQQLHLIPPADKRVICFFGSTLGNLSPTESRQIFRGLRTIMQPDDTLWLGVDLVKPREVLEEAYNDRRQVTAAFNRNILNVVNQVAGTDFEPDAFEHVAFYREEASRVEMHLQAREDMVVTSPHFAEDISIQQQERIHTENSQKFTVQHISDLANRTGLAVERTIMDEKKWFSLMQLARSG